MIITIDGPAGTGKSTCAIRLAEKINFIYFDTGALYRAICLFAINSKINIDCKDSLKKLVSRFKFQIKEINKVPHYFVNDIDVTNEIRSPQLTLQVSKFASLETVRNALKPIQYDFGKNCNSIFDGRDLGTAIFPEADIKFFLTASSYIRAERRHQELITKFPDKRVTFEQTLSDINQRDYQDSTRTCAPLKKAHDAIEIDTTTKTIEEVVGLMEKYYIEVITHKTKGK